MAKEKKDQKVGSQSEVDLEKGLDSAKQDEIKERLAALMAQELSDSEFQTALDADPEVNELYHFGDVVESDQSVAEVSGQGIKTAREYTRWEYAGIVFLIVLIIGGAIFAPMLVGAFAAAAPQRRNANNNVDLADLNASLPSTNNDALHILPSEAPTTAHQLVRRSGATSYNTGPFLISDLGQAQTYGANNEYLTHGITPAAVPNGADYNVGFAFQSTNSSTNYITPYLKVFNSHGIALTNNQILNPSSATLGHGTTPHLTATNAGSGVAFASVWEQCINSACTGSLASAMATHNSLGNTIAAYNIDSATYPAFFQGVPVISSQSSSSNTTNTAWVNYNSAATNFVIVGKSGTPSLAMTSAALTPVSKTGISQDFPTITSLPGNNQALSAVAWVNRDVAGTVLPQVVASIMNATSVGSQVNVFPNTTISSTNPFILSAPTGDVWVGAEFNTDTNGAFVGFQKLSMNLTQNGPTVTVPNTGLQQRYARLFFTPDGANNPVVGLLYDVQSATTGWDVFLNLYNAVTGQPLSGRLGQPVIIHPTYTANDQTNADSVVFPDGRVVVTYHSTGQIPTNPNGYAQIFTLGPKVVNHGAPTSYTQAGAAVPLNAYVTRSPDAATNSVNYTVACTLNPPSAGILRSSASSVGVTSSYNATSGELLATATGTNVIDTLNPNFMDGLSFIPTSDLTQPLGVTAVINCGVSDGQANPYPNSVATLTELPTNHSPVSITNNWAIGQGVTRAVTTNDFNFIFDYQTTPNEVTITISNSNSAITFLGQSGPVSSFTWAQVLAGQIRVRQDGSNIIPSFSYAASQTDGASPTAPIAANINFYGLPTIANNQITINQLGPITLTPAMLSLNDPNGFSPAQITIEPANVMDGYFMLSGQNATAFTQADINAGRVAFNVTDTSPFYYVGGCDPVVCIGSPQGVRMTNNIPGGVVPTTPPPPTATPTAGTQLPTNAPTSAPTDAPTSANTPTPSSGLPLSTTAGIIAGGVGGAITIGATATKIWWDRRKNKKEETKTLKNFVAEEGSANILLSKIRTTKAIDVEDSDHFGADFKGWYNNVIKPIVNKQLFLKQAIPQDKGVDSINVKEREAFFAFFVDTIVRTKLMSPENYQKALQEVGVIGEGELAPPPRVAAARYSVVPSSPVVMFSSFGKFQKISLRELMRDDDVCREANKRFIEYAVCKVLADFKEKNFTFGVVDIVDTQQAIEMLQRRVSEGQTSTSISDKIELDTVSGEGSSTPGFGGSDVALLDPKQVTAGMKAKGKSPAPAAPPRVQLPPPLTTNNGASGSGNTNGGGEEQQRTRRNSFGSFS